MLKRIILFLLCCAMLTVVPSVTAQSDTGLPADEAIVKINSFEAVNAGNGNIVLTFPARSKTGPVPLSLGLTMNVQIYAQLVNSHFLFATTAIGTLSDNALVFGSQFWNGHVIASFLNTAACPVTQTTTYKYNITALVDGAGTVHPLNPSVNWDTANCIYTTNIDTFTADQSGWEFIDTPSAGTTVVRDKAGFSASYAIQSASYLRSTGTITSPDGVVVNDQNSVITDALSSTPVMTSAIDGTNSQSYTDGTGTVRNVSVTTDLTTPYLTQFNLSGNCANYLAGGGGSAKLLPPTQVAYPDGSTVNLTWEKKGGNNYDGRLATLQIPQGATYTHTYSGGTNNEGVWCENPAIAYSLSAATMTISNGTGTWTFARTIGGGTYPNRTITTTVTKPDGSQVVYTFIGDISPTLTNKVSKDTDGTTVLGTVTYCYNSTISNCNATLPIPKNPASIAVYRYVPGVVNPAATISTLDNLGRVQQVDNYDFGPTVVNHQIFQYGSWNGTICTSFAGLPTGRLCDVNTQDTQSNPIARTRFAYNSTGDLLHQYNYTSLTNYLTTSYTYNANGTVASVTQPDGVQTTVAYNGTGGCNNLLPTSATSSIGTVSTTWDCNGAVPITTTNLNGLVTTMVYGDPLYRTTQISDNGGQAPITYTYTSPTRFSTDMVFNGGASISDNTVTTNTLGQKLSVQRRQSPSSSNYDTISFTYDTTGHMASTSTSCTTTIGGTCPTHAVDYIYDGNNRYKTITTKTTPTNGVATFTYPAGDVKAVLSPAPTGENTKIIQTERNGLGWLMRSCAVITSGLSGGGSCGERTAANGYLVTYTHDPLGRTTQVSHNSQTGGTPVNTTASYDFTNRITQSTIPESGTSTFHYDAATTNCPQFLAGHLTSSTDAAGNEICVWYDSLGREVSSHAAAGPNAGVTPVKKYVYDTNTKGGVNLAGHLAEVFTCAPSTNGGQGTCLFGNPSSHVTENQFSYDVYSRKTDVYTTTTALAGGYFHTTATYFDNNDFASLGGIPGISNVTYTLDSQGRPSSATIGSTGIVGSVSYDAASNPLTINYSNGDKDNYTWDAVSQNMTQYQFVMGAANTTDTGVLTWNPNGTLKQLAVTDNITSADTQTCLTGHDDLLRITLWNCGALANSTYSYSPDDAGNVTKGGTFNFAPGYTPANNRFLAPFTYDTKGRMLHDQTTGINYTWDAYGNLLTSNGNPIVHDALGNPIQKTVSGVATYYVQSPAGLLGTASSLTAYVNIRIPLPGGGENRYASGATDKLQHKDFTGSATLSTNRVARTLYSIFCFGPMGELYCGTAANSEYEGTWQDTQSTLDDFGSVRYKGAWGRSISPDGANGYVKTNSPF
jgi:YD repeat-containing protein